MGWDLPDDWGCFYTTCLICGRRYHKSEGNCGCLDDLEPCQCGKCDWEIQSMSHEDSEFRCSRCGSGPFKENTILRVTMQVALKDYPEGIQKGDRYRKVVSRGHYPDGAWGPWKTFRQSRRHDDG